MWQVSAHLEDEQDEPVGVQFQLFRIGLAGPDAPPPTSSWDARELFRGHVVLAAAAGGDIEAEERFVDLVYQPVTDAEGLSKTYRAGDAFVTPAGFSGTWDVIEPIKKHFTWYGSGE